MAKLCAFRDKDRAFIAALLDAGLVDGDVILQRLDHVDGADSTLIDRPREWLRSVLVRPA